MSVKVDQIIRTERKSTEISVSVEGYIIVRACLLYTSDAADE